jgi:hypothetical protein
MKKTDLDNLSHNQSFDESLTEKRIALTATHKHVKNFHWDCVHVKIRLGQLHNLAFQHFIQSDLGDCHNDRKSDG